jgi:hypothetical protein
LSATAAGALNALPAAASKTAARHARAVLIEKDDLINAVVGCLGWITMWLEVCARPEKESTIKLMY